MGAVRVQAARQLRSSSGRPHVRFAHAEEYVAVRLQRARLPQEERVCVLPSAAFVADSPSLSPMHGLVLAIAWPEPRAEIFRLLGLHWASPRFGLAQSIQTTAIFFSFLF